MGLLQGNGSAGIPHLQGFTWYEIACNCVCCFTLIFTGNVSNMCYLQANPCNSISIKLKDWIITWTCNKNMKIIARKR